MAVIAWPAGAKIRNIEWSVERPAQVNRSQWGGTDQVVANPWHSRLRAEVELAPIVGETNVLAWRAFIAQMKGPINTTRLPISEGAQTAAAAVWSALTASAGATTISFHSGPASATLLAAGRMITVNDQLLMLTAAATTNGSGQGSFVFEPPLRSQLAAGTSIPVQNPTVLVALAGSVAGWAVGPGQIYGIKLSFEERY